MKMKKSRIYENLSMFTSVCLRAQMNGDRRRRRQETHDFEKKKNIIFIHTRLRESDK